MRERNSFFLLIAIMAFICLSSLLITTLLLYGTALKEERERLTETAKSQARLIEAVAEFDQTYSNDYPKGHAEATLSQIRDAHENYKGFGKTGEFTLARKEGDTIVFLLSHRHYDLNEPKPVNFNSTLAEPMRLALSGKSGTIIGLDYRGESVLAAYEPLRELKLGIVAKLDLKEIRAPFIRATLISTVSIILLILIGAAFFIKISRPIINRLKTHNIQLIEEVNERKKTEEALAKSELFFKTLLNAIPLPVFYKDTEGKYLGFNQAFEKFFGKSSDQLMGKTVFDINPPELAETYHRKDEELYLIGGNQQYESQVRNANGVLRDVVFNKAVISDEHGVNRGLIGIITDITEDKKAQVELQEREKLLNEMGEMAKIGGWEHDLTTGQAVWTKEIYQIVEMDESGPIPGPSEHVEYYPPKDRAIIEKAYRKAMETGEPFDVEAQCKTAKGRLFWARAIGRPEFENGQCIKMKGTFQDISERKKMERHLQQSQKMESIGNLAGGIAHDFNNILSSVLGYTELTLDQVEEGSKIEANLQAVYRAGIRAADLVKQILTFARQADDEVKPIQVNTIAKEVIHFVRSTIPTTIEIKSNLMSSSVIMGNATQVHQIFMNLCTNAAQAMEVNGGILEISLQNLSIESNSKTGLPPGDYIEIKVADTGTGIPPDIVESIFEPYYTTKPPGEGTGMGLAVVHGIVEDYGGKIMVETKINEGTIFSVSLPILTHGGNDKKEYERQELPSGNERVMFVDDEEPIVKMGVQALKRLGYSVATFTSSIEALETFRERPHDFDLVITDATMPAMTGDELALKLMEIRSDIPIVLCTGYSKKISSETADKLGIKALVYKPVAKTELAKTIRNVLDETDNEQTEARILLIDDEPDFRKLFINKLEGEGYEIVEADNGKEGLKLFREYKPDLVVTDLIMPEKEGIEVIRELKKEVSDVKIIAVSGGGRNLPDAYLPIAKTLGAEQTFSKPIDWPEMIKAVNDLAN